MSVITTCPYEAGFLTVVELRHVSTFVFVFTDAHSMLSLTVRQLEPRHLEEDYPITMFFENKRFSLFFFFFGNEPVKFKVQL